MSVDDSAADFTEDAYRELIRLARENYRFVSFAEAAGAEPGAVLWRHDLDLSVHRAAALARIEAEEGARATYFVNLHSGFYNAFEAEVAELLREIESLGHDLGVHFDPTFYAGRGEIDEALAAEAQLIAQTFGCEVRSFSLHNPDVAGWSNDRDEVAGLVNAYAASLKAAYGYVSDSNGYWRFRRIRDVLEAAGDERLQVLTHPEWWVPEPLSPRERVSRAIDGRAAAQHARYDRVLAEMGRENVGRR